MGNVRWRGYDHPTMYDMINSGPGAEASTPVTTYWESLSKELDTINNDLNTGLSKLKVSWEGGAADSAQGGLNPLQQWTQDAQTGADIMKISSVDQAQYVSTARSSMPEPVQVTTPAPSTWDKVKAGGAAALGINGPAEQVAQQSADHEAQEAAQTAAAQKAVQTMETYQSSSEWNSSTLGTFVPSPDVVVSVNPESGHAVTHVQSREQSTPTGTGSTSGTTHASGFVQPTGTSGLPTNPGTNQPHTPIQTTPTPTTPVSTTPTPPVQTTSPNWATPPTGNPTSPTNPVPNGPTGGVGQPLPTETNPGNGNTNVPGGPGGRGPITGPVNGEPAEGPVRNGGNPQGGRGILPTEEGPNRGGVPRGGVPSGGLNEQVSNRNPRLRPGSGPNAFEEGRGGGRANIGARSASAYNYGEGVNGGRGGVAGEPGSANGRGGTGGAGRGGVGGAGGRGGSGAGDGSRGGNRFIRNANAAEAEERLGGRGGNAGANGSKGSGGRMGRGKRGEDEEDYEYQHADYLVDTEDVFLDDRLVAPPVIGDRSGTA
ncbi:PPE domain-containing protein [Labedaea rhizosphaerae]|uniref:PPE family protein n=1 Tax=Labedaea rhizosphaerae TaxID=598644 RepID=A0A4V3D0G1_LABRH|nr:PPE domain-containing protein [Labedaea rhizosphaerae]TDQ05405.1 PPE family protein [Labedaea rhizosphaerae]